MNKQLIAILILVVLACQSAYGQRRKKRPREVIQNNTIEVVQSYRPEIQQSHKPELQPELPPADTALGVQDYEVPIQTLNFTYRSQPLKPLALLGKDPGAKAFENYLKLGGGNLSTFYLDAGIGSWKGSNFQTAFHAHHLSQKSSNPNLETMRTGLEADGSYITDKHTWKAGIDFSRNSDFLNTTLVPVPGREPYRHSLTGVRLNISTENRVDNIWGLRYNPQINLSLFGGKPIDGAQQFYASLPFSKQIDSNLSVHIGISGRYTGTSMAGISEQAGIFAFHPGVSFRNSFLKGHAWLSPTIGKGGNTYLLPDLMASAQLNPLAISAGWRANLEQNSFDRLYLINPYIAASNAIAVTGQFRKDEIFGEIGTHIGNYMHFSARTSWWQFRSMPLFVNNNIERTEFDVISDPLINAFSIQGDFRYQIANNFILGANAIWFNYYQSTYTNVWHEPGLQLKADFQYRPIEDLTITAYMLMLDQIYALDARNRSVKLDPIMDIGLGLDYQIIPRLSAFMNINNLLNNKYQRWAHIPAYGFNIYGGLRLKF